MLAYAYSMIWIMSVPMVAKRGTDWEAEPIHATESKEIILSTPQTHWLYSAVFTEWFGTSRFSLSACGNQKMMSPRKQDSSNQRLETASCQKHPSVIKQMLGLLSVNQKLPPQDLHC